MENYYRLESQGKLFLIQEEKYPIDLNADVLKKLIGDNTSIKIPGIANSGSICEGMTGNIGLSLRSGVMCGTIPLDYLPIRTTFVAAGGMMMTDFAGNEGTTKMYMKWYPIQGMRLMLMVLIQPQSGGLFAAGDQYLVAIDKLGRTFRLPTTNAYENCRLCHGTYDGKGSSILDCLAKAWQQFERSEWQGDLQDRGGASGMANSKLLFRFKPLENEGFDQVEPDKSWDTYCTKVSVELISNHIVL